MWYALSVTDPPALEKYADKDAMKQLSSPAPKWNIEADEELARFLSEHINRQEAHLGNVSRYVDHITVSTVCGIVLCVVNIFIYIINYVMYIFIMHCTACLANLKLVIAVS